MVELRKRNSAGSPTTSPNSRSGIAASVPSSMPKGTTHSALSGASIPGMEAPLKALCVVPFGMEESTEAAIPDREFGLVVGEPAEFRFLGSSVRKQDQVGSLLEDWGDDIEERSPLQVTLKLDGQLGKIVPVRLETRVTELGTLEVWCVSRDDQRWKLELNIREKTKR